MSRERIECILQAVSYAFGEFKKNFSAGKTSGELFKYYTDALRVKLGDYEILYDYIWGLDSTNIDGETDKSYIPQMGDTVIMDISVGKDGYWCDVCRTFFVGSVTDEQTRIYNMIKESIKEGEAKLSPMYRAADIYKALNTVYEREGFKLIHHAGHQFGESALSEPRFMIDNKEKIKNNHFYTIESGCYEGFGIRLENDYLVTENGAENLFEGLMSLDINEYILD